MSLSTDLDVWKIAFVFVGSMLALVLFTFGMMHACVRPRDQWP